MAILFSQPSKAITVAGVATFETNAITTLAVDVNVTSISGTLTPTLDLFVERQGADGVWYAAWASSGITTDGQTSTSIGPGCTTVAVLTAVARFRWSMTGTAPSFTFSVSIEGR